MDSQTEKIRRSFNRSASTYDKHAHYQIKTAKRLAGRVKKKGDLYKTALDIGCGSGALTGAIIESGMVSGKVISCDIAFNMAKKTAAKGAAFSINADADSLPFADNSIELIASNMMLQWSNDLTLALSEMRRVMTNDGRLYLTTLGEKTFCELREAMTTALDQCGHVADSKMFHKFTSEKSLYEAAQKAGYSKVSLEADGDIKIYKDAFTMLKTLKGIGAQNSYGLAKLGLGRRAVLEKFAHEYSNRFSTAGGVTATYETIYLTCVK